MTIFTATNLDVSTAHVHRSARPPVRVGARRERLLVEFVAVCCPNAARSRLVDIVAHRGTTDARTPMSAFASVHLGASSGRVMVGDFSCGIELAGVHRFELAGVHRFPNRPMPDIHADHQRTIRHHQPTLTRRRPHHHRDPARNAFTATHLDTSSARTMLGDPLRHINLAKAHRPTNRAACGLLTRRAHPPRQRNRERP